MSIVLVVIQILILLVTFKIYKGIQNIVFVFLALWTLTFFGCLQFWAQSSQPATLAVIGSALVLLGSVLGHRFIGTRKHFATVSYAKFQAEHTAFVLSMVSVVLVSILLVAMMYHSSGGLPVLQGSVATAKVAVGRGTSRFMGWFGEAVLPITSTILYGYSKISKYPRVLKLFTGLTFISLLVFTIGSGYRGGIVWLSLQMFVFYRYWVGKLPVRKLMPIAVIILLAVVGITLQYKSGISLPNTLQGIWYRMTVSSAQGLDYIVNNLLPSGQFSGGRGWQLDIERLWYDLHLRATIVPTFAEYLFYLITGTNLNGVMGFASDASMLGELLVNLGYTGAFVCMTIFGVILGGLSKYLERSDRELFRIAFMSYVATSLMYMAISGSMIMTFVDRGIALGLTVTLLFLLYSFFALPRRSVRIRHFRGRANAPVEVPLERLITGRKTDECS